MRTVNFVPSKMRAAKAKTKTINKKKEREKRIRKTQIWIQTRTKPVFGWDEIF